MTSVLQMVFAEEGNSIFIALQGIASFNELSESISYSRVLLVVPVTLCSSCLHTKT
jgi:hypothetical protein